MHFSKWCKWENRDRLNDDQNFEIPEDFGLLGIYLLAISPNLYEKVNHSSKEIVYIGMSTNVLKRLDKSHKAVKKIKTDYGLQNLYYAEHNTGHANTNLENDEGRVNLALLHYLERKLIWEYADKNKKLPEYNEV